MIKIWNGKRRIKACLLAALSMTGAAKASASPVDGTWIIRDLVLHIFDCQLLVCGQIVWLKDATRRPSQCGKMIIWSLHRSCVERFLKPAYAVSLPSDAFP